MNAFAHKGLPALTGLCLLAAAGLQATGASGTPLAALLLAGAFGSAALVLSLIHI